MNKFFTILLFSIVFTQDSTLVISSQFANLVIDTKNPNIQLLNPNGLENFNSSEIINIEWLSTDDSFTQEPFSIYLSKSLGNQFELLLNDIENTSTIPVELPNINTNYAMMKILAVDYFGNQSEDISDNYFIIGDSSDYSNTDSTLVISSNLSNFEIDTKNPFVNIISPLGGESFDNNQLIDIEWSAQDDSFDDSDISISLAPYLGTEFEQVLAEYPNTGLVEITLPEANSNYAIIKIDAIDKYGNTNNDILDNYFSIGIQDEFSSSDTTLVINNNFEELIIDTKYPELDLISPNGGEAFDSGANIFVDWLANDDSFNQTPISLYISREIGGYFEPLLEDIENESLEVDLPEDDQAFVRLKVIAQDSFGNSTEDASENYFILGDPFGEYNVNPYDDLVILDWGWGNYHNILVTPEALSFMDDGDEIHAVDENGIITEDCGQENYGAVSVASETYFQDLTSPLNLYCLEGSDYCEDNNSISAGYVKGNPVTMLHYDQSADTFFELSPNFASWSGNFGDTPQDTLRFQYYSASENKTYIINESIPFTPSMIEGDAMFPVEYTYDENNFIEGEIECEFNPYDFEFWGAITSIVSGIESGDQFATFVNEECRGINPAYEAPFESPFVFLLDIYGNAALSVINSFNRSSGRIIDVVYDVNNQTRQDYNFNIYRNQSLISEDMDEFYYIDDDIIEGSSYCYSIMLKDNEGNELLISENQCIDLGLDLGQLLGDINGDDLINILDIVALVTLVVNGGDNPVADMNEDGLLNILDIVFLVNLVLNT